MLKVRDFYDYINNIAPFDTQEPWDNSGMLVGSMEKEVCRVVLTLDITREVVEYAKEANADLIISHHPVIFNPIKKLDCNSVAYLLAQNSISAVCAHTCLDKANGGVNDVLARVLELEEVESLSDSGDASMLRAGVLPKPMTADELAFYVKDRLHGLVRYNNTGKIIESVALCGGAGCSLINEVVDYGIDCYITGDANHHDFIDAQASGLSLMAAGHFETENPTIYMLSNKLRVDFPNIEIFLVNQKSPINNI